MTTIQEADEQGIKEIREFDELGDMIPISMTDNSLKIVLLEELR